jgi:L-asparaginase II
MQEEALVEVVRAGQVESRHNVSFAVVDSSGQLRGGWGNPDLVTYLRSSAKPFQAIPFVESGAADHYDFVPRDLALVCASHAGMAMHEELALELLEKIGEPESSLQCGMHVPYDVETHEAMIRAGELPKQIQNNCSGKHIGMLGLAKFMGAELLSYLDAGHPVQQRVLQTVAQMTELPIESIVVGIDGCSAPNFAIPLYIAARAYARLVEPDDLEEPRRAACRRIIEAMMNFPEFVAGPGRFDTQFMRAVNGRMVSKSGAEGFQAVGIPKRVLSERSPAIGITIKVHDGDDKNHRAAALTAIELVDRLGGFHEGERDKLKDYDSRSLRNLRDLEVGEVRIASAFEQDFKLNHEWL